jgi:uncharacterized protein YjdB
MQPTPSRKRPPVVSLAISPEQATVAVGQKCRFKVKGKPDGGDDIDLTDLVEWETSDKGVATIEKTGEATGVGEGGATIKAAYTPDSPDTPSSRLVKRHYATAQLDVQAPAAKSITVLPANPSIALGNKQQFSAIAT